MASNPEREGFVRPARAAFSSTVSRRRRASACSDASTSFEPCRQVVDVLETTGRQLSSWHINTPGLSRRLVATPSNLLVPPIRISHVIAHFVFSLSFFLFFYSTRLSSRSHDQSLLQKEKKTKKFFRGSKLEYTRDDHVHVADDRSSDCVKRKRPGFCLIRSAALPRACHLTTERPYVYSLSNECRQWPHVSFLDSATCSSFFSFFFSLVSSAPSRRYLQNTCTNSVSASSPPCVRVYVRTRRCIYIYIYITHTHAV